MDSFMIYFSLVLLISWR